MATLATHYYIKALDYYPYNLEEATESLNYAIGYDDEHSPSLCLMGRLHIEQLKDARTAKHYFELALLYDDQFPETYYHFSEMLIRTGNYQRAKELLKRAKNILGIDETRLLCLRALMYERKGNLTKARSLLVRARMQTLCNDALDNVQCQLQRVDDKLNAFKKSK